MNNYRPGDLVDSSLYGAHYYGAAFPRGRLKRAVVIRVHVGRTADVEFEGGTHTVYLDCIQPAGPTDEEVAQAIASITQTWRTGT